jgi:hypothetical protein
MSQRKPARLTSGMQGNGAASGVRKGNGKRRDTPYRVVATSAGQWSTSVSHNTNRIWRDER